MDLIVALLLEIFIVWIDKLPPFVSKTITGLIILFFGGFAGMFGYGAISGLFKGDPVFTGITFAMFSLFACVTIYFFQLFLRIGKKQELPNNRIINLAMVIFGLLFFVGFFGILLGSYLSKTGEAILLWRKAGLLMLAILGLAGCIYRLKQLLHFKNK